MSPQGSLHFNGGWNRKAISPLALSSPHVLVKRKPAPVPALPTRVQTCPGKTDSIGEAENAGMENER